MNVVARQSRRAAGGLISDRVVDRPAKHPQLLVDGTVDVRGLEGDGHAPEAHVDDSTGAVSPRTRRRT
jgi:hypothetical protein